MIQLRSTSLLEKLGADKRALIGFLQAMVNRMEVGRLRYGAADRRKKYMDRALVELRAYKTTGNMEHLFNVANYCVLESIAPQHANFHHDPHVDSATRARKEFKI